MKKNVAMKLNFTSIKCQRLEKGLEPVPGGRTKRYRGRISSKFKFKIKKGKGQTKKELQKFKKQMQNISKRTEKEMITVKDHAGYRFTTSEF